MFKEHLPELDDAIRRVSGYGGNTPIVLDSIQSLEKVFDRYSLLNSNDWNTTLELKLTERPLNTDEKQYLQLTDRLILVAKTDNKNIIKPGALVRKWLYHKNRQGSRDLIPNIALLTSKFQSLRFNIMAMTDIEWVENGIDTVEKIDRNTKMDRFTTKLAPSELFQVLEGELDLFDVFHEHTCNNLESISTDVLYTILVLSQRNISNHPGKFCQS